MTTSYPSDEGRSFGGDVRRWRAQRIPRLVQRDACQLVPLVQLAEGQPPDAHGGCARGAKWHARQSTGSLQVWAARPQWRNVPSPSPQIFCFRADYPCCPRLIHHLPESIHIWGDKNCHTWKRGSFSGSSSIRAARQNPSAGRHGPSRAGVQGRAPRRHGPKHRDAKPSPNDRPPRSARSASHRPDLP